jgi:signal transduction histidine kinase
MRFRTRLLLGFGAVIGLLSAILAINLYAQYSASVRIRSVADTEFAAERAVQDSAQIVLRVKGEVWDALFLDPSRREAASATLADEANAFKRNVDRLVELMPAEKEAFLRLGDAFRSYFVFASSYLEPGRAFAFGAASSAAPDVVMKFGANQDELMSLLKQSSSLVERAFEASLQGLNRGFRDSVLVSLLGAGLSVLAAVLVALGLSRRLTQPIAELARVARSVAGGDFAVRSSVPGRVGEASILASVFNSMLDEIERNQEGLEAQVRVRTEELARSNESLVAINERLASAYGELEQAQGRLLASEKRAVVGRMVANIAHELNTPLAAISSSSASARAELESILPELPTLYEGATEEERGFFLICVGRAGAGLGAVDPRDGRASRRAIAADLRAAGLEGAVRWAETLAGMGFSGLPAEAAALLRTERGERLLDLAARAASVLRSEWVVELAVVKAVRVIETLRSYANRDLPREVAGIELRSQLEGELAALTGGDGRGIEVAWTGLSSAWVEGDREELALVWMNILANAFHAMGPRGKLSIDLREELGSAIVTIVDDGPGIPEELRGRVFEPFFSTKPFGQGKGLGLDLSKRIVERHGGSIGFESAPGRTAFAVALPARDSRAGDQAALLGASRGSSPA